MEREIRRRLQLKESNELAIECRRRQKEKEMEEEEAWRAKMLIEMEKVLNSLAVISICIMYQYQYPFGKILDTIPLYNPSL